MRGSRATAGIGKAPVGVHPGGRSPRANPVQAMRLTPPVSLVNPVSLGRPGPTAPPPTGPAVKAPAPEAYSGAMGGLRTRTPARTPVRAHVLRRGMTPHAQGHNLKHKSIPPCPKTQPAASARCCCAPTRLAH